MQSDLGDVNGGADKKIQGRGKYLLVQEYSNLPQIGRGHA
jgi:hypothetical protein